MTASTIQAIYGHEPQREGEYPSSYTVGYATREVGVVTKIERREEFFGDHAICWFDVYVGDHLAASMSARGVAEVNYANAEDRA